MNTEQEAHVKAMARKIEGYAQAINQRMQALQRNSLADMPTNVIGVNFQEVTDYCESMRRIVNEELPRLLPPDEPQHCEVCENQTGPFIRVEVSEDGERYHWLNACSDECLHQVTLRWKQTTEIIRPGDYQPKPLYRTFHETEQEDNRP